MPNIVLSRIDERLIHGQVGVQWVGFAGANLVLVKRLRRIQQSLLLPLSFLSTITNFVLFLFSPLSFQFLFYRF